LTSPGSDDGLNQQRNGKFLLLIDDSDDITHASGCKNARFLPKPALSN